jgi:hypothetical protein
MKHMYGAFNAALALILVYSIIGYLTRTLGKVEK